MNKIKNAVLQKIQSGQQKQLSKNYFVLVHILAAIGVVGLVLGAIYFWGVSFSSTDFEGAINHLSRPIPTGKKAGDLRLFLPLIPFSIAFISSCLVFFIIKKTDQGYKVNRAILISIFLIPQILLGLILHSIQQDKPRPNWDKFNLVEKQIQKRQNYWFNPAEGRLVGKIKRQELETPILIDPNQKEWTLEIEENLKSNAKNFVRITGSIVSSSEKTFKVETIQQIKPKQFIKRH